MQQRAMVISAVFFLIIGVGAYSLTTTISTPSVGFKDPEYLLAQEDEFSIPSSDQTYTMSPIAEEEEPGGHGGRAVLVRPGELTYVNDSVRYTKAWNNGNTVTLDSMDCRAEIANVSGPSEAALVELYNEITVLQAGSSANSETVTCNDEHYIVVNGPILISAGKYFPTNEMRTTVGGDSLDYSDQFVTVITVKTSGTTTEWFTPEESTAAIDNEASVAISDQQYLAYLLSDEMLVLTRNYDSYQVRLSGTDRFHEIENGL